MTASVTRRRREDEEKNLAEQVELMKISYFSVHLFIVLLMHIRIAYLLVNAYYNWSGGGGEGGGSGWQDS